MGSGEKNRRGGGRSGQVKKTEGGEENRSGEINTRGGGRSGQVKSTEGGEMKLCGNRSVRSGKWGGILRVMWSRVEEFCYDNSLLCSI